MLFIFLILLAVTMIIYKSFIIIYNIFHKMKISSLLENIDTKEDLQYIQFKNYLNLIAEVFVRKGYTVRITDKCGEEGNGFILNNIQYVEILRPSSNQAVDSEVAMKLAKCMQSNSIYRGMLITLGDFKQKTKMFCHKNVIECINGEGLLTIFKEVQKSKKVLQTS